MPDEAIASAARVLSSGYIGEGVVTQQFESRLSSWLGHDIALVDSCTSAISLALHLAGVKPGSEVISTPMTCLAANAAVHRLGARVRWCDIDPRTGQLDPSKIKGLIRPSTRAILFVDWAGTPARSSEISRIAKECGIKSVEDAAHALGARTGNQGLTFSDYTCYSFQAVKHLTTINGGALRCGDEAELERARRLRWFGLERKVGGISMASDVDVPEAGFKMHMVDPQAAIGVVQLNYIEDILRSHRSNAAALSQAIETCKNLEIQESEPGDSGSYLFLTLKASNQRARDFVVESLSQVGIESSQVHRRNDRYSAFSYARCDLSGVDDFSQRQFSIPCGWWLSSQHLEDISLALTKIDTEISGL